jgi:hypothetical protein
MLGYENPFNVTEAHMGLGVLAEATGGIAVLNKNDFDAGLGKILDASDGYYLLAYTPTDTNFDKRFRKVQIKVKGDGLKVFSREGYFAREDPPPSAPLTKQQEMLAAIKSPLARQDIDLDAAMLYRAVPSNEGRVDIQLVIDPAKLKFEDINRKHATDLDIAGFVYDGFGKLRGGFSQTVRANLTDVDMARIRDGGFTYAADTKLPAGVYQIRLVVRDNKTGGMGTLSKYLEIPDLSKGRLWASSIFLESAQVKDTDIGDSQLLANARIPRTKDLRYTMAVYNATKKNDSRSVTSQVTIAQGGQVVYDDPEQPIRQSTSSGTLIKRGQLGLSRVKPGRYRITITITDHNADKSNQVLTRTRDFLVVE